jgi:hypothetical protein
MFIRHTRDSWGGLANSSRTLEAELGTRKVREISLEKKVLIVSHPLILLCLSLPLLHV